MARRQYRTINDNRIQGKIKCPNCSALYPLDARLESCKSCGAKLPEFQPPKHYKDLSKPNVPRFLQKFGERITARSRMCTIIKDVGQPSLKDQFEGSITCGWCGAKYEKRPPTPNCSTCAGPLPMPPSNDPGPEPPPPPRHLPPGFFKQIYFKQNLNIMPGCGTYGCFPAIVPLLIFPLFITEWYSFAVFLVGLFVIRLCFRTPYQKVIALKKGQSALGVIESIKQYGQSGPNHSPYYEVYFRFVIDGKGFKSKKVTFDSAIKNHFVGEPIWVVYLPKAPHCCAIWPPLA